MSGNGGRALRPARMHPQVRDLLQLLEGSQARRLVELTPHEAREQIARLARALPDTEAVARREDLSIAGPGGPLRLRVLAGRDEGPQPVLLFLHGGGWVTGTLDVAEGPARSLAVGARCTVVTVEYRLAPEHPFPTALDDVAAALEWIASRPPELDGNAEAPTIGGISAGANLAAAATLRARDRGEPAPAAQLLICPITDCEFETASMRDNGEGLVLEREDLQWFWHHYLRHEADADSPYASPLRAPDLSRLPPAVVITAELDPLRDQGESYARRLRDAGVPATVRRYPGMTHAFVEYPEALDAAEEALADAAAELRAVWGSTVPPG